ATLLHGTAVERSTPWAYFHISKADTTVVANDTAYTDIVLDSSSLRGNHKYHDTVTFDPTVLSLLGGRNQPATLISPNSVVFSGTLDFDFPGHVIETLLWRTLLGPNNFSNISSIFVSDTSLAVHFAP